MMLELSPGKKRFYTKFLATVFLCLAPTAHAHEPDMAQYLANEGVLVSSGEMKILFDPFFHNGYGNYKLVPEKMRAGLMAGEAPYDGINAIFISHAHGDHFDADDVNAYLSKHTSVKLVAPLQAIDEMKKASGWQKAFEARIYPMLITYESPGKSLELKDGTKTIANVTAVRIPHAGGESRRGVQNIVYRVSAKDGATVMHLGDADPDDKHFARFEPIWATEVVDMGFPPYWFFATPEGNSILTDRLNIVKSIGVHVPINIPPGLPATGADFFSQPGEVRLIEISK